MRCNTVERGIQCLVRCLESQSLPGTVIQAGIHHRQLLICEPLQAARLGDVMAQQIPPQSA
jgi:hypothetical protein